MAKKLHWTQRSQARRNEGQSINDEGGGTWQRGYAGEDRKTISSGTGLGLEGRPSGGFNFLGFTDPKTKIRRGIFGGTEEYAESLRESGFKRVKFNASIRDRDVSRDYKFNQFTSKQGFIFNRPVFRLKKR